MTPQPEAEPLKPTRVGYSSVQCTNPACYFWTFNPIPGSTCVKCAQVLPIWVGHLNADKDHEPPVPLERTAYQESWFYDEPSFLERTATAIDDEPSVLKRTNKEQVVQDISTIYGLDRKGAVEKLDQLVKSVVVEYV